MRNGSDNRDGIYARVRQDIVRVGCQFHRWIYGTYAIQGFLTDIRNRNDGGIGNVVKITDDIRAPIPVANDTNLQCGCSIAVIHGFLMLLQKLLMQNPGPVPGWFVGLKD